MAPTSESVVGMRLGGKYRIIKPIARGSSGQVYEALQEPIDRPVAVKIMRGDREGDREQFEARFIREASVAGRLQHPNIVTVFDFGFTRRGVCYLVMEMLQGRLLSERLRDGRLNTQEFLGLFEQIIRGLRHAHSSGLVHRDMKPDNILLVETDEGERPKILDFGLVKAEWEEDLSETTLEGTFLGTPRYVSPEQARGDDADVRSDIYSVGVMMYEAITGVPPYEADSPISLAVKHISEPFPELHERAPGVEVPPELVAVIRHCMEKEASDRYGTADELIADLRAIRFKLFPADMQISVDVELPNKESTEDPSTQGALVTMSTAGGQSHSRKRPWLVLGLVGLVVTVGAGVVWMKGPGVPSPTPDVVGTARPVPTAAPPPTIPTAVSLPAGGTPTPEPSNVAAVEPSVAETAPSAGDAVVAPLPAAAKPEPSRTPAPVAAAQDPAPPVAKAAPPPKPVRSVAAEVAVPAAARVASAPPTAAPAAVQEPSVEAQPAEVAPAVAEVASPAPAEAVMPTSWKGSGSLNGRPMSLSIRFVDDAVTGAFKTKMGSREVIHQVAGRVKRDGDAISVDLGVQGTPIRYTGIIFGGAATGHMWVKGKNKGSWNASR